MKKKTYMINHIPIKQMWLEENIILIKHVQKWVNQKMLKNPMKKNVFYNISKDQSSKIG
jgi:intergrase/recombinase